LELPEGVRIPEPAVVPLRTQLAVCVDGSRVPLVGEVSMRFRKPRKRWSGRSSYASKSDPTDEEYVAVLLRIPWGNGDPTTPSLAGGAVVWHGAGATVSAAAAKLGSPASTLWEEEARAALRRSGLAWRERLPERLLHLGTRRGNTGSGTGTAARISTMFRMRMR
jgi:hypothetical protein